MFKVQCETIIGPTHENFDELLGTPKLNIIHYLDYNAQEPKP